MGKQTGDQVRFGIIGCGAIAKKHGEALKNIAGADLVAVCDLNEERAREFATKYGGKPYTDYRRLLDDPQVDAVIVTTPSGLHARMGLEALDAGKHALIEKPLALKVEDAEALIKKAEEKKLCLGTVHPNRMYPTSRMVYEAIHGGRLGKLSHAAATLRWNRTQEYYDQAPWRKTREMDGGILFNQAWHALDLMIWFMGPVAEVQGMTATRLHDIETEDVALLTMRFQSGALGLLEATTNVYPCNLEQTIAVFGEKGTVILGGSRIDAIKLWRVEGDDEEEILSQWGEATAPCHSPSWAHEQVIKSFLAQVYSNRIISPEVQTGLAAVNVIKESRERVIKGC